MIIGITLIILTVLSLLSLIIGNDFISGLVNVSIDNEALVDGVSSTFVVAGQSVLFTIDTSSLITAGIALIATVIFIATITGISVLGSGINTASARIIVILTAFGGIWTTLSILAFSLIVSIEIFGSVIYIALTIAYAIGVVQIISGGNN